MRWVHEHTEQEACSLVEGDLIHWEKMTEAEGIDPTPAVEYVQLARSVLSTTQRTS